MRACKALDWQRWGPRKPLQAIKTGGTLSLPATTKSRFMKAVYTVIGALLIVLGGWVLFGGLSFSKNETVLQVGGLKAQVQRDEPVPQWAGVAALVAGLALVAVGLKR